MLADLKERIEALEGRVGALEDAAVPPALPVPTSSAMAAAWALEQRVLRLEGIVDRLEGVGRKSAPGPKRLAGVSRETKPMVSSKPSAAAPARKVAATGKTTAATAVTPRKLPSTVAEHEADEKTRILDALAQTSWNRSDAAALMNIPRRTFYRRLTRYGIK